MEIQVQEILKTKSRLIQIYVQHNTARKSYNDFYGDMERDNFMNPDESLKYGLIDKIIDKDQSNYHTSNEKDHIDVQKISSAIIGPW